MISIKLARHGLKNTPFYHIVVLQSRSRPTRKPIEQLGTFNPIPNKDGSKDITLNFERAKYWIGVGAKPSESVARILAKVTKKPPLSSMATLYRNGRNALGLLDSIPLGRTITQQKCKGVPNFFVVASRLSLKSWICL